MCKLIAGSANCSFFVVSEELGGRWAPCCCGLVVPTPRAGGGGAGGG